MDNKKIWVLGYGKFGQLAVRKIIGSGCQANITIIDHAPEKLSATGAETVCQNGIEWLAENLVLDQPNVDIIIPTIPLHVAAEWLIYLLNRKTTTWCATRLPDAFITSLPNPVKTDHSQVITSFANTTCPLSCSEPEGYCSVTGEKRPIPLFQLLKTATPSDFTPVILRSHQLFPGIGGLYPEDFHTLLGIALKPEVKKIIIATSCRCHGIANAIART